MLKNILLHVRYPYTAGIIAVIWLGTAVLCIMRDDQTSLTTMLVANVIATTAIAHIGFSNPRK